jgi:hypothetical protein
MKQEKSGLLAIFGIPQAHDRLAEPWRNGHFEAYQEVASFTLPA